MILEDVKYQIDQFHSFDNIKLQFNISGEEGLIYYNDGKITRAVFEGKEDLDVFRALKNLEGQTNIQVSIGEPAPEKTLNRSFDEIIEIMDAGAASNKAEHETKSKSDNIYSLNASAAIGQEAVIEIGRGIANIQGVEGILAINADGEVLYSKDVEDPDFESADSMFLYNQSRELGDILDFKNLKSTICEAGAYRKIIINNKDILYSIKVSSAVQPLKTQMEAVKLLEK